VPQLTRRVQPMSRLERRRALSRTPQPPKQSRQRTQPATLLAEPPTARAAQQTGWRGRPRRRRDAQQTAHAMWRGGRRGRPSRPAAPPATLQPGRVLGRATPGMRASRLIWVGGAAWLPPACPASTLASVCCKGKATALGCRT
jgi:hypothetical protein